MSKSLRILSIALIIFSLFISFYSVYASDINMNLTTPPPSIDDPNTIANDNSLDTNTQTENQIQAPITQTPDTSTPDTTINPSSVGTVAEEGLTFSNILNILLITVGVVLIFLAIGIMIKLK